MATNITISTGGTTTVVTVPEVQNNITVSKNEITSAEREKISNMVTLDGAQTISGAKTFTANTNLNGSLTVITGSVLSTGPVTVSNQDLSVTGSGDFSVGGTSTFSGTATYNADLIASSLKFIGNGTSIVAPVDFGGLIPDDLEIRSNGNVVVKLDYDNDESGQKFKVTDNSGNVKFSVDEDGSVAVSGSLSVGAYTGSPVTDTGYLLPSTKGSARQALLMDINGHALGFRGISFSDINVSNTPPPAGSPPPGQFYAKYLLNSDGSEAVNVNHGGSNLSINSASMPNSVGLYVNGDARVNGAIQVGDAFGVTYAFPTTDGTANQVLATDGSGAVTFVTPSTSNVTEGTNLYYTDARVAANSAVAANTAKNSYPTSDATKLAGIAAGAEVNVNADWNASTGDAQILNKPSIPSAIGELSDVPASLGTSGQILAVNSAATALEYVAQPSGTNLANSNLTADDNRTYDQDGNDLIINPNGGAFEINDSSGSPSGPEFEVGQGTVTLRANSGGMTIQGLVYPDSDGTNGQVLTTNGSGTLSFTTVSGGGGGGIGTADQTLDADRTIDTNGYNLDIELDPTGTADTFTIHDGTHDLFQVDTGTTGTIFSVNDVSGLPKLTVDDSDGVTIDKFKEVKYEKPSNTDFSYQGDVVYFGATTSMTQGDLYYYNSSGNWAQADADAASSSGGVLLAIALGTASDTNGMLLKGTFTMAAGAIDGTEATGDELYVSTTAGHVTSAAPTAAGDIVRVVGYMLDGTNGQIWFNPSNDFITLA